MSFFCEKKATRKFSANEVRKTPTKYYPFFKYAVANVLFRSNRSQQGGIDQRGFLVNFPLR